MSAFIPQHEYETESDYSYCPSDENEMTDGTIEEEEADIFDDEEYDEGYEYHSSEYVEEPVSNFKKVQMVNTSIPEINPWTKRLQEQCLDTPIVSLEDIMKDQKRIQEEDMKRKSEIDKKRAKFKFIRMPRQETKGVSLLSGKKIIKNTDLKT